MHASQSCSGAAGLWYFACTVFTLFSPHIACTAAEVAIRKAGGLRPVLLRAGIDLGLPLDDAQVAALTGRPQKAAAPAAAAEGEQQLAAAATAGAADGVQQQDAAAAPGAGAVQDTQQLGTVAAGGESGGGGGDATKQLGGSTAQMPSFDWGPDEEVYFHSRHYEPVMQVGVEVARW